MNSKNDIAKPMKQLYWFFIFVLAINLCITPPLAAQEPRPAKPPASNVPVSVPKAPALGKTSWGMSFLDPVSALSSLSLFQWGIGAAIVGSSAIMASGMADDDDWPNQDMLAGYGGPSKESFETVEYKADWGLGAMQASTLYAQVAAGKGITVSMSDSGIRTTHQEFTGKTVAGAETASATAAGGNGTLDDPSGHGTHVAGTMIGTKDGTGMHGVAWNAKGIYVIEGGNPAGSSSLHWTGAELQTGLANALAAGSRVHNNSWGSGSSLHAWTSRAAYAAGLGAEFTGWLNAASNGLVQVFATGNDSRKQPSIRAGAAYYVPELKNMWIGVVAVDSTLTEASFTNRCGDAWESCMAAPGVSIYSSVASSDTAYSSYNGTSMAAPHVSGALAALMSRFPGLTSKEIVKRLLGTATYKGLKEYGSGRLAVDMSLDERRNIFGRGLVQLVAAGKPLGGLSIVTGGTVKGLASPLNLSNISLGTAFGDGLQKNLHGVQMAVFDNFQRATFWVDVNQFVQSKTATLSLSEGLATLAPQIRQQAVSVKNWGTLQMTSLTNAAQTSPRNNASFQNVQSLSFTTQFRSMPLQIHYDTIRALSGFGLTTFNTYASLLPNETILVPYAAFARNGLNLSLSSNGPGASRFTFTTAYGKGANLQQSSLLTVAALHSAPSPTLNLATHVGLLLEPNTFLGSNPQGAFQLAPNTPTYFLGNAVSYRIYDRYLLEATNSWGFSRPQPTPGSLITNLSPIVSNAFSLGLTGPVDWMEKDRWGIRISQPLRVVQGSGTLTLAQQRNQVGTIFSRNLPIDLRPLGRQLDLETFYESNSSQWGKIRVSGLFRQHPGHQANLSPEGRLGIHYQQTF